jgi:nucleoside phosphorylase
MKRFSKMASFPTTDVLVVAAHPPELAGLALLLGADLSAEIDENYVLARAVGIGLVASAVGTSALLAQTKPGCVIVTGTCGVYAPYARAIQVGSTVIGAKLGVVSTSSVEGRGACPAPMQLSLDTHGGLSDALAANTPAAKVVVGETLAASVPTSQATQRVGIATTLAITTADDLAQRISETTGYETEHLESFAIVSACAHFHIPVAVVLGVANVVGRTAREEWRRNHETAGRAATDVIASWIRRGAPGRPPPPSSRGRAVERAAPARRAFRK